MATVLIVDDSRTSRRILRNLIESNGYTVVGEAENGEIGFLRYKELKPDIVTMDITMPQMDGIESLSLIKHEDPDAKVSLETNSLKVTLTGKEKLLNSISADDIFGVAELSSADLSEGQHTIGVSISSPDGSTVSGNYSVVIRIIREKPRTEDNASS